MSAGGQKVPFSAMLGQRAAEKNALAGEIGRSGF